MFLALCNSLICPVQKPVDNLTVAVSVILKQSMMTSKENPTIRLFSFYSAGQVDTNFFRVIIIAVCWSVSWSLMCLCCFSLSLLWTHRLFKSCNRWKSWDSLGGGLENAQKGRCSLKQCFYYATFVCVVLLPRWESVCCSCYDGKRALSVYARSLKGKTFEHSFTWFAL